MKKLIPIFVGLLLVFGMTSQVRALSIGDLFYVGSITAGIGNTTEQAEFVNYLTTVDPGVTDTFEGNFYDRYNSSPDPLPLIDLTTVSDDDKQEGSNTTFNSLDYNYIIGKYDAEKAGLLVWYNADGFSGDVVLPETFNGQGLSHTTGYNAVPIPATVFLLLPGLVGLAGCRRRLSNK